MEWLSVPRGNRIAPAWMAVGALTMLVGVGVGVGVGLTLMATQRGTTVTTDSAVAVATVPAVDPVDAVAEPSAMYRGDGMGKVIAAAEPAAAAAQLAANMRALGCGSATREVRATVYVEIDTTPKGCMGVLPVLAKLGFAPETNGRLAVRYIPSEKR